MRVIVRYSLNGPNRAQTLLRQKLKRRLENQGIKWTGNRRRPHTTSTYEAYAISEQGVHDALEEFWAVLANTMTTAHIDHFWMYVDRKPPAKRKKRRARKS